MKSLVKISSIALISVIFNFAYANNNSLAKSLKKLNGKIIEYVSDGNGFNTKTIFYEGQNEVVAFDAQFTTQYAKKAIKHLRKFTNKPISWLVITHPNPDKFNGASVFKKEGAKILSSELTKKNMPQVHAYKKYYFVKVAKMFPNKSYPKMPTIDETFENEFTIKLKDGESIILREYGRPAVSLNQTVATLPNNLGIVVGDLIHHNAHAWLEGGINESKATPTISEWIELLKIVQNDHSENINVYGGRGEVSQIRVAIPAQIKYLKKSEIIVENYIRKLGNKKNELISDKANEHYTNITQIFKKEFPNYNLPYMIQYGVYGLVNSKF